MSSNGHAALAPLSVPEATTPAATPAPELPIEQLGEAIADAVISLACTIEGYQRSGVLDPAAREEGGSRVAKVVMLQLDHELGDDDFANKAHYAGRQVLLRRYFTNGYDRKLADAAIGVHISIVLMLTGRVVKGERALAN
jgi:hypothetical protein